MTRRTDSRHAADRKRYGEQPFRKWYASAAWRRRRLEQLARVPWCEPCKSAGKSRPANVANHNPPHRGDRAAFFHGPLESCCASCHDSFVQRAERDGFRRDVGADGWPKDPSHPWNKMNATR